MQLRIGTTMGLLKVKRLKLKFEEQSDVPEVECLSGDVWILIITEQYLQLATSCNY